MPWVRVVATSRAKPTAASQAENASNSIGAAEKLVVDNCIAHTERVINKESIIASRHRRAERRWVR